MSAEKDCLLTHRNCQMHSNKMILKQKHAEYFKQDTIRYVEEREKRNIERKKEKGMSAASVDKLYNQEYGCNLSAHSIL